MLHQIWHLYGTVFLHNINNFDIKPVVLTVMWSSVKFSLNLLEEKKLPLSLIWRMKVELSGWIEESTSGVWRSTYLSSSDQEWNMLNAILGDDLMTVNYSRLTLQNVSICTSNSFTLLSSGLGELGWGMVAALILPSWLCITALCLDISSFQFSIINYSDVIITTISNYESSNKMCNV